jgi:hypothetical protein
VCVLSGLLVGSQPVIAQCGHDRGVLEGDIANASTGALLDSVAVTVQWIQVTNASARNYEVDPASIAAVVDHAHFRACGVPVNAPVRIRVARKGYHDIDGEVTIPPSATLQRNLRLVPASIQQGTGIISGRVLRVDSQPVQSGKAMIRRLGREVPIANGHFSILNLPAGSWPVEIRALGYTTAGTIVDVPETGIASANLVLAEKAAVLEGMTITAASSADIRTLEMIMVRKRVGFGTFFLPGDPRLERALYLNDVARYATGFHLRNDDSIEARYEGSKRCIPTIYVDGMRNPLSLGGQMEDVLAVAAFPDMTGVPVEYRDMRNCAVILVWMKK